MKFGMKISDPQRMNLSDKSLSHCVLVSLGSVFIEFPGLLVIIVFMAFSWL